MGSRPTAQSRDGLPVVYSGDDERNNYILERFGIVDPTPQTVAQLTAWHTHYRTPGPNEWPWGERAHLIQLVLLSADFQMA